MCFFKEREATNKGGYLIRVAVDRVVMTKMFFIIEILLFMDNPPDVRNLSRGEKLFFIFIFICQGID